MRASILISEMPVGLKQLVRKPALNNIKSEKEMTIMSSASAGSRADNSGEKNFAQASGETCPTCGRASDFGATSTVAAEAQQGDGPAAASASASSVMDGAAKTSSVSVVVGADYAAAACEFGAVVVGPNSAAAASQVGVAAVGPAGAAATSNSANSSSVAVFDDAVGVVSSPGKTSSQVTDRDKQKTT